MPTYIWLFSIKIYLQHEWLHHRGSLCGAVSEWRKYRLFCTRWSKEELCWVFITWRRILWNILLKWNIQWKNRRWERRGLTSQLYHQKKQLLRVQWYHWQFKQPKINWLYLLPKNSSDFETSGRTAEKNFCDDPLLLLYHWQDLVEIFKLVLFVTWL